VVRLPAEAEVRSDRVRVVTWTIVLLALVLTVVGTYSERWGLDRLGQRSAGVGVSVGQPAPSFSTTNLAGATLSLEDFRGRVVVLNFWATWCPPCRVEMPELDAYQAEMGDRMVVLGIDMGEPATVIAPFVREYGLRFPILLDESGTIAMTYAVTGLPTSIILDRGGIIRERVVGAMTRDGLARRVERLL
jgi:peroxiredoxin